MELRIIRIWQDPHPTELIFQHRSCPIIFFKASAVKVHTEKGSDPGMRIVGFGRGAWPAVSHIGLSLMRNLLEALELPSNISRSLKISWYKDKALMDPSQVTMIADWLKPKYVITFASPKPKWRSLYDSGTHLKISSRICSWC